MAKARAQGANPNTKGGAGTRASRKAIARAPDDDYQARVDAMALRLWRSEAPRDAEDANARAGAVRSLVCKALARGDDVDREDVAIALRAYPDLPIPSELVAYAVTRFVLESTPLKTGPKRRANTLAEKFVLAVLLGLRRQGTGRRAISKEAAKHLAAASLGLSVRKIERIIAEAGRRHVNGWKW